MGPHFGKEIQFSISPRLTSSSAGLQGSAMDLFIIF